jgi:formylglycine-generating enzyme
MSASFPVETVDWNAAQSYCHAVGGRLPTGAEWEYSARGKPGSSPARYGNLDAIAWFSSNSGGMTHAVGEKQANAFGLYDMLGNLWHWTSDWYGETYYHVSDRWQDPEGPPSGTQRALRGGSWIGDPQYARVSYRGRYVPGYRSSNVGFRCVGGSL